MMQGLKETKIKKFEYYLRQCLDCDKIFKADKQKCKYCQPCKSIRVKNRIRNSLKARGMTLKEERTDVINNLAIDSVACS